MNKKLLKSAGVIAVVVGVLSVSLLNAESEAEKKALRSIRNVPAPELPARAAHLVSSSTRPERTGVGVALAKTIAVRNPHVLRAAVAAIAAAAPETAAAVTAAAAAALPRQAGLLAVAASHAAPGEAVKIAAEVARVAPDVAVAIANTISQMLPQETPRIMTAVAAAAPNSPLGLRQLTSSRSATHIPGHAVVTTRSGPINPANAGKPLPTALTNVIEQRDPERDYAAP